MEIRYIPLSHDCSLGLPRLRFSSVSAAASAQQLFFFSPLATSSAILLPVFKPRTIDSEPALYDAAIKILMRRAHSVYEMKKALIRRTADENLIKKVLARLKQNGLIDDARYAQQFARQRTEIRKQGKFRVARELRARGVPDRHIAPALEAAAGEVDEAAMVRQRLHRKLKLSHGEVDDRKIASLYRSLLRAGFSSDTIRRELRRLTEADLPDVDTAAPPDESA
jgi:regulatory protein